MPGSQCPGRVRQQEIRRKVIKIGVFEPTTGENGGGGFQEVLGIRYANQVHPTVKIGGEEYAVKAGGGR